MGISSGITAPRMGAKRSRSSAVTNRSRPHSSSKTRSRARFSISGASRNMASIVLSSTRSP